MRARGGRARLIGGSCIAGLLVSGLALSTAQPVGAAANPAISIITSVNGADADNAPGLFVRVGDAVTFTYSVTNTGDVPLVDVSVFHNRSDAVGPVTCPAVELAPAATMLCTSQGVALAGLVTLIGTVTARPPSTPGDPPALPVMASNPASYFGEPAGDPPPPPPPDPCPGCPPPPNEPCAGTTLTFTPPTFTEVASSAEWLPPLPGGELFRYSVVSNWCVGPDGAVTPVTAGSLAYVMAWPSLGGTGAARGLLDFHFTAEQGDVTTTLGGGRATLSSTGTFEACWSTPSLSILLGRAFTHRDLPVSKPIAQKAIDAYVAAKKAGLSGDDAIDAAVTAALEPVGAGFDRIVRDVERAFGKISRDVPQSLLTKMELAVAEAIASTALLLGGTIADVVREGLTELEAIAPITRRNADEAKKVFELAIGVAMYDVLASQLFRIEMCFPLWTLRLDVHLHATGDVTWELSGDIDPLLSASSRLVAQRS
jgi:hypothetical protein